MRMIAKTKGYKVRINALSKLDTVTDGIDADVMNCITGCVLSNDDGTYSPCVILVGRATALARYFADSGVHVVG